MCSMPEFACQGYDEGIKLQQTLRGPLNDGPSGYIYFEDYFGKNSIDYCAAKTGINFNLLKSLAREFTTRQFEALSQSVQPIRFD